MSREKSMKKAEELWPLLTEKAMNHEVVFYAEARDYLGYKTCQPVNHALWNITNYCGKHNLPPLTAIVISKETGTCGQGFQDIKGNDIGALQQKVFNFNWNNVEQYLS